MSGVLGGIEACIPALRRYARTLLGDPLEADDLVHDCLVRALGMLHTRREGGDLRVWLFAIIHDLYVNPIHRSKAAVAARRIAEIKKEAPSSGLPVRLQAADLLRAVESLPEPQRSVLVLVTLEDLSYTQVANILGIPLGAVMSQLAWARDRLAAATEPVALSPVLRRVK